MYIFVNVISIHHIYWHCIWSKESCWRHFQVELQPIQKLWSFNRSECQLKMCKAALIRNVRHSPESFFFIFWSIVFVILNFINFIAFISYSFCTILKICIYKYTYSDHRNKFQLKYELMCKSLKSISIIM